MGSGQASPRRAELHRRLGTAVCRALDSQARGGGAGRGRAPGPSGAAARGAGVGPPRALQSQGLGLGPGRTAGGAEAWPRAARGSSPGASLRGAWHSLASVPPPTPPAPRRAGTLGLPPPGPPAPRREPLLDSEAGRGPESSDTAGPRRHDGSIIHGAQRALLPRPALPSASPEKWGGEDRGKSSQSKVGHISRFFPK